MFAISPVAETAIFATYKRQQTMLERQRRLNFFSESHYYVQQLYSGTK